MDLALSESELLLKNAVQEFVRHEANRERLVGMYSSGTTWQTEWLDTFAAAGWLGLFVPNEFGGTDATATMAAVVFEELGRGPVPGPLLFSSGVGALLVRATSGAHREMLLSGIAVGSHVVIPALQEPGSSWRGASVASADVSDAGRLTCTKLFVPHADTATHFLVSLRESRFAVVPAAAEGVQMRPLPGFLQANSEVTFTNVEVRPEDLLTAPPETVADAMLAPALVALAAYQTGGAGAVLDMSIDHANTREQFGVPIGRFQRVQDHVVRILNAADGARWSTYEAAWCVDSNRPEAAARAHLAAAIAGESFIEATNAGHEVHAGIGSDPKMGLVLYTQASRSLYQCLGTPDWHRLRMVDALGWAA